MGFRPYAVRSGHRRRQHLRARALTDGQCARLEPADGGRVPAREEYLRRATLHNHGLPARESLLIASDSLRIASQETADPDSFVRLKFRSLTAVEEAVRRYPEDPMPWYCARRGAP